MDSIWLKNFKNSSSILEIQVHASVEFLGGEALKNGAKSRWRLNVTTLWRNIGKTLIPWDMAAELLAERGASTVLKGALLRAASVQKPTPMNHASIEEKPPEGGFGRGCEAQISPWG
jgi:hypothetical protein